MTSLVSNRVHLVIDLKIKCIQKSTLQIGKQKYKQNYC